MTIHKTCNFNKKAYVELPTGFIDNFLLDCPPVYPLIYIWSYRRLMDGGQVSTDEIMKKFRLTGSDVHLAWKHWEEKGLVSIGGENMDEVNLLDVAESTYAAPKEKKAVHESLSRPTYTPEEIAIYRAERPDVARLYLRAEKTLGKLLSFNDMSVIFGFHDWLRLPIEVIEYLLSYCDDNDHRNLRYIEKCAIDWADNEIDSLERAMLYVKSFDANYRKILRHMGVESKYPAARQREHMDNWLNVLKLPIEVILFCCDSQIDAKGKATFGYVNTVLTSWHKAGVKTLEDAEKAKEAFSSEEKTKRLKKPAAPKTNRFINFNQREYDWAALEKIERAYQDKKHGITYNEGELLVANDA